MPPGACFNRELLILEMASAYTMSQFLPNLIGSAQEETSIFLIPVKFFDWFIQLQPDDTVHPQKAILSGFRILEALVVLIMWMNRELSDASVEM